MSGRPRPGGELRRPLRRPARDAEHDRVLDRGDVLDAQPDGRGRGRPGRDAVGDVGGGPDRLARHDDEPGVQVGVVDAIDVQPFVDLRTPRPRVVVERAPAGSVAGARARVRRNTSGRWASSSKSASASIRPVIRT